jgi:myo-inositol-1-phosphate synthase
MQKKTLQCRVLCTLIFGGYHVMDVRFVAAFDVNRNKIGKDLADAIWLTLLLSIPTWAS